MSEGNEGRIGVCDGSASSVVLTKTGCLMHVFRVVAEEGGGVPFSGR